MADDPTRSDDASNGSAAAGAAARVVLANRAARGSPTPVDDDLDVIQVIEETLRVAKVRRATGGVRVGTRTETVEATAEVDLDRYGVEVTRVPVGRVVDEAPMARAEGDTTIISVIEERLVLVKQLFLVEELHVRHVVDRRTVTEPVTLRRQRAVVERLGDQGESSGQIGSAETPFKEP